MLGEIYCRISRAGLLCLAVGGFVPLAPHPKTALLLDKPGSMGKTKTKTKTKTKSDEDEDEDEDEDDDDDDTSAVVKAIQVCKDVSNMDDDGIKQPGKEGSNKKNSTNTIDQITRRYNSKGKAVPRHLVYYYKGSEGPHTAERLEWLIDHIKSKVDENTAWELKDYKECKFKTGDFEAATEQYAKQFFGGDSV
jgi:hypothetical protein